MTASLAYTRGSVVDGHDPRPARAAWAAVLLDDARRAVSPVVGGEAGVQAELTSVPLVAEGLAGSAPVVAIATTCGMCSQAQRD